MAEGTAKAPVVAEAHEVDTFRKLQFLLRGHCDKLAWTAGQEKADRSQIPHRRCSQVGCMLCRVPRFDPFKRSAGRLDEGKKRQANLWLQQSTRASHT
jgi:hypothetical protein